MTKNSNGPPSAFEIIPIGKYFLSQKSSETNVQGTKHKTPDVLASFEHMILVNYFALYKWQVLQHLLLYYRIHYAIKNFRIGPVHMNLSTEEKKTSSNCYHLFMSGWEDRWLWNIKSFQTSTEHKYFVKVPKKYLLLALSHFCPWLPHNREKLSTFVNMVFHLF